MKKILTTILAGTLVAGAAFAADAKITLNFRSRLNALHFISTEDGDTTKTTRNWMNWDNDKAYNGAGNDGLKFVLNGDRAGATFELKIIAAKSPIQNLGEYSAWMNFPIGPGTLTLRTGAWKDGYADGAYRVKKDVDAQNGEGCDFERFKLGSILNNKELAQLTFVDSLNGKMGSSGENNESIAGFADYGFNVNDNVSLNILVGGVSNNLFDKVDGDPEVTWNSAFSSRAQVKVKDVLNAELIYKLSHKEGDSLYHTFGLYVMPQVLDALTLNVGGAAEVFSGKHGAEGNAKGDYFDWGVDLRLRYQVMKSLSITFFTNVSGTSLDDGRTIAKGVTGYKGGEGFAAKTSVKVAMWNNLSGRYKINDLLTATLNVGLVTPLSKGEKFKDNSYAPEWRVTPAVQIYAASNASLWAGVAISGASWTTKAENSKTDHSRFAVEIPVIFRVKM